MIRAALGLFVALSAWQITGCRCNRHHHVAGQSCSSANAPTSAGLATNSDAESAQPPFYVLVWMESTPPGAEVVVVSNGFVLGRTPDTFEFLQSNKPVLVRFEMRGFNSVTRELPVLTDSSLSVVLEAIGRKRAPARSAPSAS